MSRSRYTPVSRNLDPAEADLDALLRRLSLPTVRRSLAEAEQRACDRQWGHREFLAHLIVAEVLNRDQTRVQRLTRRAGFPYLKTIDDFAFGPKDGRIRRELIAPYLAPDFAQSGLNLVLGGRPGRGKTHLAIAIAFAAIQHGADARFVTAAHLIDDLTAAAATGRLIDAAEPYRSVKILVIDEIGYLPHARDAANVLYQIVDHRYHHRRPIIFTTNKALRQWGAVLHDRDLAEALLDRVLENGRFIECAGPSGRTGGQLPITDDHTAAVDQDPAVHALPAS